MHTMYSAMLIYSILNRASFTARPSTSPTEDAYSGGITLQPTSAPVRGRPVEPVSVPTKAPSNGPSAVPSLSSHPSQCADNGDFESALHCDHGCEFFALAAFDCYGWSKMLTVDEMQELFTNCPITCEVQCG